MHVLLGEKEALKGVGSSKVLESGPDDNVFIYFTDHGAVGKLLFLMVIDACESGSMLEDLLPNNINVYATTASNAQESSYACYYDDKRQTYLGDVYSVVWIEDSDAEEIVFEFQGASKQLYKSNHNILKKYYNTLLRNEFVLHKLYIMANLCEIGLFDFTIHQAIDQVCNERLHFDY
ncbi:unnamed protein product [Adineta steineri]|uniref:Legumain n=1 Tax=Adineta steineri TaxID=433720 RepID=A0A819U998_9BILA|nr:unnamed protein product [Adineta steineri]